MKNLEGQRGVPTHPDRKIKIKNMIREWHTQREICTALKVSPKVVSSCQKELNENMKQDNYLQDIDKKNAKNELNILKKKNSELLTEVEKNIAIDKLYKELSKWGNKIKIEKPDGMKTASTAVMVASDWHVEETVDPETVNYLNEYNIQIAEERAKKFFANGMYLIDTLTESQNIDTVILALLWDFISWYIHPELMENNGLSPTQATLLVRKLLISGIDYILENCKHKIVVVTAFGNHWRTTEKKMISTSWKNSYEWMMYNIIADEYKDNDRIQFKIEKWYHNYINVYDKVLRTHHGDWMKYQGWVGWITIPVNKAIAQRNKAKHADIDVFGHRHQLRDWGNYVSNGSLIGYWPYAESIKADFEEPRQAFFLINSEFGKTISAPILLK